MSKILVANQNLQENLSYCQVLSSIAELKILSSNSGLETLNMYNEFEPNILILDSNFSDMPYLEIINKLSASVYERKKCNIIVTTRKQDESLLLSNVIKVWKIFIKPFNFEDLLKVIYELKPFYEFPPLTEIELNALLLNLNFNLGTEGTRYVKTAITECYNDSSLFHSLDNIYPIVATVHNKTIKQVRDGMRSALIPLNKYRTFSKSNSLLQLFDETRNITPKYFLEIIVTHLHCKKMGQKK